LAAILFADVVGYSRMVAEDEAGALAGVRALRRRVVEPRVAAHGGRPFAALGDGFVAEFPSAVEAVACAVAVQRELAAGSGAAGPGPPRGLALRIGINLGDVVVEPNGDVFGDGVNVAARLEALAEPGGIAISGKTLEELRGRSPYPFEDAGERMLKNIPWPVPVSTLSAAAISELPTAELDTAGQAPRRPRRTMLALSAGFLIAGLAASAAWWALAPRPSTSPPATVAGASKPVVAVLPFTNLSREARWDRLCDGLSEDIITDLARHPDLLVIARNSAFAYKGRELELREVGRALGARYVLEGSLQADAGRLRVTAQLIDAPSGTHVWAGRYDRAEADLFAVQDEVVNQVVTAVAGFGGAILRTELRLARRRPPASLRAYELYLLGYEQEARLDRDGTLRAIELLEAGMRQRSPTAAYR
jgi:TolB-like protein/class 3 adenylate cyclase